MPELPEVETVRRVFETHLLGQRIVEVEVAPDEIVLEGVDPSVVSQAILGRTLVAAGRKGKYWWLEFDQKPILFGHLGMAGWVRHYGGETIRLREHGQAPLDDATGRPKFLKLSLTGENGQRVVMTDGRRLARMWLGESPETDETIQALGPDCYLELPTAEEFHKLLSKRSAPIKALLLDQKLFAGVGNWIADEVMYHAGIAPKTLGKELTLERVARLREALDVIIRKAVDVGADSEQFPKEWLFHTRWGGGKGDEFHQGEQLVREQIGGRTTAWVPSRQN
jgi:formamidopyrimidine-DNA glycosylase